MRFSGEALALVGRPIAFYPVIGAACGGLGPGVLLCQLIYWHGKQRDPDGWIRKSWTELAAETGMTRREQQGARACLRRGQLLDERVRGIPPTVEFKIAFTKLNDLLTSYCTERCNQLPPAVQLNAPDGAIISETTTETTAESTYARPASLNYPEKKQQDPTDPLQAARATVSKPQTKIELGDAFETFWKSYPPRRARRERKAEAWSEYQKLSPPPELQARMLVAVRLYAQGNELPVDCCRWIKRRQWEDEVEVRVAKRVPVAGACVADVIPDDKPDRSPEAIAKVRAIVDSIPWLR